MNQGMNIGTIFRYRKQLTMGCKTEIGGMKSCWIADDIHGHPIISDLRRQCLVIREFGLGTSDENYHFITANMFQYPGHSAANTWSTEGGQSDIVDMDEPTKTGILSLTP